MAAIKLYESSGFCAPKVMGVDEAEYFNSPHFCFGDEDVGEYYRLIGTNGLKVSNPTRLIEMLRKARVLLGGIELQRFFQANLTRNKYRSDLHYEFLKDTANFINTGKRAMNIHRWFQLLTVPAKKTTEEFRVSGAYSMKLEDYRSTSIQKWISHDGGVEDLLYSLYIFFGKYTALE